MSRIINEIRRIVGNPDGTGGENGVIEFQGALAECFVRALDLSDDSAMRERARSGRTRIQRAGGLELWINGFYVEGSSVRRITAKALDLYQNHLIPGDGVRHLMRLRASGQGPAA